MHTKMLLGLLICSLLTVLLAACAIRDAAAGAGPTVHMSGTDFVQKSVTIHKGDMLNLVDDAASTHIIVNGSWVNGSQVPKVEPGAPTVNVQYNGNDSSPIGPFNTAGTFHVYCTIHQNMNLTIIVQ
jgi:plastocyanin